MATPGGGPVPLESAGFTVDEAQLRRLRQQSLRRLHVRQIPAMRVAGFAILAVILLVFSVHNGEVADPPGLARVLLLNTAYCAASWIALWRWHGRTGRLDLGLVFMHLDLPMWLVNLHHINAGHSEQTLLISVLLVRVADQVGFGFRRALYFCHVAVAAYLGYTAWLSTQGMPVAWLDRLSMAFIMYIAGGYLSLTGLVTQRLRERVRRGVHAARDLIQQLERQTRYLRQQAEELQQARAEAEQASEAKSRFLSSISHELRTPLNGVMGMLQLMQGTGLTPQQRQYTDTALESSSRLVTLIEELLDVASIRAGGLALHPQAFNLAELVRTLLQEMQPLAQGKPLQLECELDAALDRAFHADARRLRQLLFHLLHNGLKFTDLGEVRLHMRRLQEDDEAVLVRMVVSDTGCGMTPTQLDRLFAPFEQADNSNTRRHGGSGLGLAIAHETVMLMQGSIRVRSELGRGTAFEVEIRLRKAQESGE
ncbi:sensor histidine kinase [Azohydromonas lata]|uniref:histidine kinase n=1 Tax=Azohydromonas lata TaxID=45677 RepID=A0ABU5ID46_9BURK|nr:ATP-binding protein [Azohydromonas lata]MDZ5457045.1 ATP-binding protein [Azohydromonas lata]